MATFAKSKNAGTKYSSAYASGGEAVKARAPSEPVKNIDANAAL